MTARSNLRNGLQDWLNHEVSVFGGPRRPWGELQKWGMWSSSHEQPRPRKRGRGSDEVAPQSITLFRSDGIQDEQDMLLGMGHVPLKDNEVLPCYWTPYQRVARTYGNRTSTPIWISEPRPKHPFWLFASRYCEAPCAVLVDLFRDFMWSLQAPHLGCIYFM